MQTLSRENSTNVRFDAGWLALLLWALLVAALHAGGALERLGSDLAWLTAFACAVAALAYAVDAELRRAVEAMGVPSLSAAFVASTAAGVAHPAGMLAFAPAGLVLGTALVLRAFAPRVSSTAAASPGARPDAL